ncbi:MAG: MATE family efflux transporter [Candidatus Heteroscillospira sp.]
MHNSAISQQFFRYVSLNVLGMLGLSCYILADTVFVAQGLGADGLTALSLALPVFSFINGVGLMSAMGGGTRFSIAMARGDSPAARRVFHHTLRLAMALSLVFLACGLFLSGPLSRLLGARGLIFDMTADYLRLLLLFSPAFILNSTLSGFARNDGRPGLAMAAMLAGSLANIVMDYIFIFPLGLGISGAAAATCCAPIIGILILSPHFVRRRASMSKIPFSPGATGRIISLGMSAFVNEVSGGVVMIAFNTVILGLMGDTGVAAYGVVANLAMIVLAVFTGIAQGAQPLISSSYGGGRHDEARRIYRMALLTALICGAAVFLLILLRAEYVADLFNKSGDALLRLTASRGLRIYFSGFLFAGCSVIIAACFSASGFGRQAFAVSACRGFALILPALFVCAFAWGMDGVWLSFPITEFLTLIFAQFLLTRTKMW